MNFEQLDFFLYQPATIRYGTRLAILILALLIIYFFFIMPINDRRNSEQLNYQLLMNNIAVLEQKIDHYPSQQFLGNENERLRNVTQKSLLSPSHIADIFSKKLVKSPLILVDFKHESQINKTRFQLQLLGSYQEILEFVSQLTKQELNIKIDKILITKEGNKLSFSLSVIYEHNQSKL